MSSDIDEPKQLTWWLQLVESTALENYDTIRGYILAWETTAYRYRVRWDSESPMPTSIEGYGVGDSVPDFVGYLEEIQFELEDREYMIFSLMTNHEIMDRAGIRVYLVTRRVVATIAGAEMIERAKRLVMASEEELLAAKASPA